jgi:multiple sugar transport system permease protein
VATPLDLLKSKVLAYWEPYVSTRMARREAWTGIALIAPWLLGFLLLKLIPIACSLAFSLTDFDMLHPEDIQYIGLGNYARILTDGFAGFSLFSTLSMALITLPLQLPSALFLATLLNSERVFGKQIYRTLIFLPSVIPGAAIAFVWFGFLDPTTGWLNRLLIEPLGLPPYPGPFTTSGFYLYQIITALWSIGPGFLVMLGAMKGVPTELYEAARVDGAGPMVRFLKVTVPIISPAIFFALVINLVSIFGGAPLLDRGSAFSGGGQSAFDNYIYNVMFRQNQLGYASSLAWVIFVVMLLVTIILFRTARHWVYYPEEQ